MATFSIVVTSSPLSNLTNSAQDIVEAIAMSEHEVKGVFFYQQGVLNASNQIVIPADETQTIKRWQQLKANYNIPLHLCSTAAEKHGLINDDEETALIDNAFTLSGLGELVVLTEQSDKVIQL